jgi:PPOX class probable F420-dependent enzyme
MIITTRRRDGSLQSSPVTAGVNTDGRIVVASYPERAKVGNIRRDPRVSVLVLSDSFNGPWVQVETTGTVIDLPEAVEPLVEYFRCISGEHSDWDEYRKAMVDQGKCLLQLEPVSWGPIATGGFPARLA